MSDHDEFEVTVDAYFSILPEWILDADISDRAYRLYGALHRYAGVGGRGARPTRKTLSVRLRTSLSSIDRALRELQAIGAVTIRHRWTNSNLSSFTYDRDDEHPIRAASGYLLRSTPAKQAKSEGGVVTGDDTPTSPGARGSRRLRTPAHQATAAGGVVPGPPTPSSPVTRGVSSHVTGGVSSRVTRGVSSPVTHEREPVEPKPVEVKISTSAKPPRKTEPIRADVESLCAALADGMVANDCRRPTITDAWRREARLLLDADGRDHDKALRLIAWCQADSFWASNIHSMQKFRKQYEQLRMRANEQFTATRRAPSPLNSVPRSDQKVLDTLNRGEELKRRNAAQQFPKEIAG